MWLTFGLSLGLFALGSLSGRPFGQPAAAADPAAVAKAAAAQTRVLEVGRGDSLYRLLRRAGVEAHSRAAVIDALGDLFDPRSLRPGDRVRLVVEPGAKGAVVRSLHLELSAAEDLTIDLSGGTTAEAAASSNAVPSNDVQLSVHQVSGRVGRDFAATLRRASVPADLVREVSLAFRYDPDAPRKPSRESKYDLVYELTSVHGGRRSAELRYAELDDGHKRHRVYRYQVDRSLVALVHEDGKGVALLDLDRPLGDAPVTSPWGWRIHPVLGGRRFHKGVDFGAPKGTPIRAAAKGVIETIGWRGNYGEYIRLRHDGSLETAYAHLSGFAHGLHRGSRVERGQVIGYVGSTGLATGPHLYYEVLLDGKQVNPLAPPQAFPVRLQDADLNGFRAYIEEANAQ
ncbi:M23 family metallopeptidase [Tistlia consotensis]|uniref:M23 family metallopeptidase n=1 Tax=Tistlia consotensis TaxID=1321365 RepID=UPI001180B582|nr:M23 family metallopeptidase [Tistlia consotensis]